jgi:hypothetical protein
MSEELEAAGAFATAALAANAIDHPGETHAEAALHGKCANCQAPLTGNFCNMCGQSAHIQHSLLHLAEEVVHGVLHFDAKGWRTIPLLVFLPGRLTRRYIDGQRKTYVSPLALFLFMVFLTFFVASFSQMNVPAQAMAPQTAAERQASLARLEKRVEVLERVVGSTQAKLDEARAAGKDTADLQSELADATENEADARGAMPPKLRRCSRSAAGCTRRAARSKRRRCMRWTIRILRSTG